MAKIKTVFECQACGNQQSKWVGKCPQCGAWDSFLELNAQQIETLKEISKSTAKPSLAKQISEVEIEKVTRISTQNSELDLVLGGGVVEGGSAFEQGQAVLPRVGVGDEVGLVVIL